jgi:hypothetical protein
MIDSIRRRVGGAIALLAAVALALAACGSPATTPESGASTSSAAAGSTAPSGTSAVTGPTADPALADALAQLNGLTSYQFKFTLQGGSYASSVGPAGIVGTVVNSPSFAVQFTYADIEVIAIHGNNWTRNGASWDPSPYPDLPTVYDSYGPATLLGNYFPSSVAAYYTAAGDETVNDVLTTRYTAAPQILNSFASYWGISAGATLGADIWIAKDGGYPVRWKVTGTGTDDFQFLIDITKANDPGNVIDVPTS